VLDFISCKELPFVHFGASLPRDPSPRLLHQIYKSLYDAAANSVHTYVGSNPGDLELHPTEEGVLPISYNLAMTTDSLIICPRRREGEVVKRRDGTDIAFVALNGTLLAGTLMVKRQELYRVLQEESAKLEVVLAAIGIPWPVDKVARNVNL